MKPTRELTPTRLRATLVAVLLFLLALGVVVFMLGYRQITEYSHVTQEKAAEAQKSNSKVQDLMSIKRQLEENSVVVTNASQLVSESTFYAYQDQIIRDINAYATKAGITLETITFNDAAAAGAASTTTGSATSPLPAGIKATTATVTFRNPINYTAILRFVHSLEQSLFRMSVLGVSITKSTDPTELKNDSDAISCDPINIEVYIK